MHTIEIDVGDEDEYQAYCVKVGGTPLDAGLRAKLLMAGAVMGNEWPYERDGLIYASSPTKEETLVARLTGG